MPKPKRRDDYKEMQLLFVPYIGDGNSSSSAPTSKVSQQQHAAREFHRQARLRLVRFAHQGTKTDHEKETRRQQKKKQQQPQGSTSFLAQSLDAQLCRPVIALGAGRVDPFNAYCVDRPTVEAHEMLDHGKSRICPRDKPRDCPVHWANTCLLADYITAVSYQWSVFRYSSDLAGLNELKKDVMTGAMRVPATWYTVIYAGATHNAFNYKQSSCPRFNEVLRLTYREKAIKHLKEEIAASKGIVRDEVFLSIIALGAHGYGEIPQDPGLHKSWTSSCLGQAHNVDYYGAMDTAWEHLNALRILVARRGGLGNIKLKAAAHAVQLYDVFTSWRLLKSPIFPLIQPTSFYMGLRAHQPDQKAFAFSQTLGSGFFSVLHGKDEGDLKTLLQAVRDAAELTVDLDQYNRKTSFPPDLVHIQFVRWCITHDLLSLPEAPGNEDITNGEDGLTSDLLYRMIRLSTFGYGLFTLIPIPAAGSLPHILAERLQRVLDTCITLKLTSNTGPYVDHPGIFLWSVMIGGMCAYAAADPCPSSSIEENHVVGSPLLDAYVLYTRYLPVKADISGWPMIVNSLAKHLWLESECDELGEVFWCYACGRQETLCTSGGVI